MQVMLVMRADPSAGSSQVHLSNNLSAAVVKSRGSERSKEKAVTKQSCTIHEDE